MQSNKNYALVILSGGQDSTTSLFWAMKKFSKVVAITFNYGQRHSREIECAKKIAFLQKLPHNVIEITDMNKITSNSMMEETEIRINQKNNLPTTFVPGRNLLFVTLAAAYAYEREIPNLVLGVSQADYSGYPDCREDTMISLEKTIQLGMDFPFQLHTPLLHKSKKETVLLAKEVGALESMQHTHTCYKGQFPPCGECPACVLRAKGFHEAGIDDPIFRDCCKIEKNVIPTEVEESKGQ